MAETHIETIQCPECGFIQDAIVEETIPWFTYIHECDACGYLIAESEWNNINKPKPY